MEFLQSFPIAIIKGDISFYIKKFSLEKETEKWFFFPHWIILQKEKHSEGKKKIYIYVFPGQEEAC